MRPRHSWRFSNEIEARQRNILWPDTLRNEGILDAILLKGSPNATLAQRIGMVLIGLMYSAPGILLACLGLFEEGPVLYKVCLFVLGLPFLALGGKIIRNAFRHSSADKEPTTSVAKR